MNTYRNIHARQQKHGRSRKKRTGHLLHFILPMLCLILLLCTLASYILNRAGAGLDVISPISSLFHGSARDEISHYASSHGYDISDYPQSLIDLYDRNRETKDFVFEYPMKKSKTPPIDLSDLNTSTVPLLMQWDQRWGYQQYAGDLFGLSGIPTALRHGWQNLPPPTATLRMETVLTGPSSPKVALPWDLTLRKFLWMNNVS